MSDIFDEVDEILDEIDSSPSAVSQDTTDANYNESELNDIISEIENLEKEFETEQTHKAKVLAVAHSQEVEVDHIEKDSEDEIENVLPMTKTTPMTSGSEISFEAHGQMNLNLAFKIGKEMAQLTVDPVKGLCVKMNGVELVISDSEGCMVTMESGVKFTIPLTSQTSNLKKKTA